MDLALSLGETPKPFTFLDKSQKIAGNDLVFCMALGETSTEAKTRGKVSLDSDLPIQLDLMPFSPVPRSQTSFDKLHFSWLNENCAAVGEPGNVNRRIGGVEEAEEAMAISSPNSTVSSFQMEFSVYRNGRGKRDFETVTLEGDADRGGASSRASDDEENSMARKKLRLTKEQSAFLEESFKEQSTLNPKQKLALAKQLNLRPRQVEVWFQNRRARTKLKQTEVDCEYLKSCCETLTEENRRLQKELQELRALKASQPFYMQLPATTLSMCPSCERVSTTTTSAAAASPTTTVASAGGMTSSNMGLSLANPKLFSFAPVQIHAQQAAS